MQLQREAETSSMCFSGSYLYIEASDQDDNEVAILGFAEMSIKPEDGPYCLTFGYHMYGEDVNQLKVVRVEDDGQETTLLAETGRSHKISFLSFYASAFWDCAKEIV